MLQGSTKPYTDGVLLICWRAQLARPDESIHGQHLLFRCYRYLFLCKYITFQTFEHKEPSVKNSNASLGSLSYSVGTT